MKDTLYDGLCLVALVALIIFGAAACEETTINNPTGPLPPIDPVNNSQVTARAGGACTPPCVADFSVTLGAGEEVAWIFTGGTPPTSSAAAGSVSWPGVGTFSWSSRVCDAGGRCSDAQGTVTFTLP